MPPDRKRLTGGIIYNRFQCSSKMPELKGKAGIKAFLLGRIGETVTTEQIREASGGQGQYGRRLRELHDEDGWPFASHNDTPDLKPGEYRLTETPPSRPLVKFARGISARTRAMVLERNGFTCQMCGIGAGDKDDKGRKARLHMGHIVAKSEGGADTAENLRALCAVCNQGATNLTMDHQTENLSLPHFASLAEKIRNMHFSGYLRNLVNQTERRT